MGGIGVGAANHYYQQLEKLHESRGMTLDLVMAHAETRQVLEYVQTGDGAGLADYFAGFFRRMQAAGAEVAVLPSVTSHYCLTELRKVLPLPVIDLFTPLNRELARRGVRRVAVFGTRYVIESGLYGRVQGLEFVTGRAEETDYIHKTYLDLAMRGRGTPEDFAGLTRLGLELCRREELDAILLGGTDLALVFDEANTEFPAVDCAALHIAAIAEAVLG